MRNIWTIAKREYENYFNSPLAYAIAFGVTLLLGVLFSLIMFFGAQQAMYGAPDAGQLTWWLGFILILVSPALTMRLLSDEARMGTLELLLTAPVRDFELIAGKWLGSFLFILTLVVMTLIYPIIMNNYISPGLDWKLVLSSYIGVILLASALLALGTGISAVTNSQFVALFTSLMLFIFLWIFVPALANFSRDGGGEVFRYLGIGTHFFESMNSGTITLGDIVYYLSLTALGLFTGTTAVEIRRWR
jgi:ABC-2 type transport system permease protein